MTAAGREGLSEAALAMTQPIIDELIKDISRRIKDAGGITDTAEYQIYRAQALGASKKEIEKRVAEQLEIQQPIIDSLFEYVVDQSASGAVDGSMRQVAAAYAELAKKRTAEQLKNLWADTADGQTLPLQEAYAHNMDFAFRKVITGAEDLETALRRATDPLAKRGLRTIEQKSGRSVGIEYVVRRYLMDQLGQLDDVVQQSNHDALGCDGWEISAHAACAPDHEEIQGRQFTDAEFEALNNSLQRRIGHLNCGHTASPVILGVNEPQYTDAELQRFKDENARGIVYNGHQYTLYEAGQKQSSIENGIRMIKRQCLVDEETGNDAALQKRQIKLRVWQAEYKRFCKAAKLPTRTERLRTAGFGRVQAGKAWGYRSGGQSLADIAKMSAEGYTVTDEIIENAPKPFFRGLSNRMNTMAQGYGRQLLRCVKDLPKWTEASIAFTQDGTVTSPCHVGADAGGRVRAATLDELGTPYYALHNHASNGMLSPPDVWMLIKHTNMRGIGAYGNGGALFTCEKVYGYDYDKASALFRALKAKFPLYTEESDAGQAQRIEFALELIKNGETVGLHFN